MSHPFVCPRCGGTLLLERRANVVLLFTVNEETGIPSAYAHESDRQCFDEDWARLICARRSCLWTDNQHDSPFRITGYDDFMQGSVEIKEDSING